MACAGYVRSLLHEHDFLGLVAFRFEMLCSGRIGLEHADLV